jgi:hypothetical protein
MYGLFAGTLTLGSELDLRALGKRLYSKAGERVVSDPQLVTSVHATTLTSQPLAVEEMRARKLGPKPRIAPCNDLRPAAAKRAGTVAQNLLAVPLSARLTRRRPTRAA